MASILSVDLSLPWDEISVYPRSQFSTAEEDQERSHHTVYDRSPKGAVSPDQATLDQYDIDSEAQDNMTSLSKVDIKPRPHLIGAFREVDATLGPEPSSTGHGSGPIRRKRNSLRSIYVGESGTAHRWKPGSEITFNINRSSFPNLACARHAAKALRQAASEWNKGDIGVTFRSISDHEQAVFQLAYSENDDYKNHGGGSKLLAESFFPYEVLGEQQPKILLFRSALDETKYYKRLANIFHHELGHVLGLRHEFAQRRRRELKRSSMRVGEENPLSVMNYFDDPNKWRIQGSDYAGVKTFYSLCGEEYSGFAINNIAPRTFAPS